MKLKGEIRLELDKAAEDFNVCKWNEMDSRTFKLTLCTD